METQRDKDGHTDKDIRRKINNTEKFLCTIYMSPIFRVWSKKKLQFGKEQRTKKNQFINVTLCVIYFV